MNEEQSKEKTFDSEKDVFCNKLRKINSARGNNLGRKIVLYNKNKKLFPADFFNKTDCEKKRDPDSIDDSVKLSLHNSIIQSHTERNHELFRNKEIPRKIIHLINDKKGDMLHDKNNKLNVILEEDEEKIRTSTKNDFFTERKKSFLKDYNNQNGENKESKSKSNKGSIGWDKSVFFPPVIDISTNTVNLHNSVEKITENFTENSLENIHNISNSKTQRNQNLSSNETSMNSYNLKQKINNKNSLKVNINLDENSLTPSKNILFTPKEENKRVKVKAFFSENIDIIKYKNTGIESTKNQQRRSINNLSKLNEKFNSGTKDNRPNSVLFCKKGKKENKKLNFDGISKEFTKSETNSNTSVCKNPSRNSKHFNLPLIENASKIDQDLKKIIQACYDLKEDPVISSKLTNIIKNIDDIKNVMKTKSARNMKIDSSKLLEPSFRNDLKEEKRMFTFVKFSEKDKLKALDNQKDKKLTRFNTNLLKLPVKIVTKDNKLK